MPNVVKGSKQRRMIVVPYRPWFRLSVVLGLLLVLVVAGVGSFFYGRIDAARQYVVTTADNARLSQQLSLAQDEMESLRSQLASSMVDRRANEEVQSTINSLRQRIMQLEQDVSFYRQVMSPDSAELGLIIAEFDVNQLEGRRYHYKAVFRQAGAGDRVLEGKVTVALAGRMGDERKVLPLADILPQGNTFDPELNFRYFQNLEGEFELPEGFVPEQVEVKAESTKPAANKVEKIFSWSVVEA